MGIEPTSSAWKAEVIAIIRHPQVYWWRVLDSNQRRLSQQIYSLPPLTARETLQMWLRILPRKTHLSTKDY